MANPTPKYRKVHIKRIKGVRLKNGVEEETDDFWIDTARIEEIKMSYRPFEGRQRVKAKLKWNDKPGEDKNPKRKSTILKIYNPEDPPEDPDNPEEYVPFEILDEIQVRLRAVKNRARRQKVKIKFKNDPFEGDDNPKGRNVIKQRITHYDLPEGTEELLMAGEIVVLKDYEKLQDTNDEEQYVDVEVIKNWKRKQRPRKADVKTRGRIKAIIRDTDYTRDKERPENPDPPTTVWRLDPLQNIINVKWEEPQNFLMIGALGSDDQGKLFGSKNGKEWDEVPCPSGHTVAGAAYIKKTWFAVVFNEFVPRLEMRVWKSEDGIETWDSVETVEGAFQTRINGNIMAAGTPKKINPTDIVKPTVVYAVNHALPPIKGELRVSNDLGESWTTIDLDTESDESTIHCVSFANGLFFAGVGTITYQTPPAASLFKAKLFVSQNGYDWTGIDFLPEVTDLTFTSSVDELNNADFGTFTNVSWDGAKENPKYVCAIDVKWGPHGPLTTTVATSVDGFEWGQSSEIIDGYDQTVLPGAGPYTLAMNDAVSIAAGPIKDKDNPANDGKGMIAIPIVIWTGEVPPAGSPDESHEITEARWGVLTKTDGDGTLEVLAEGVEGRNVINGWVGGAAFSTQKGGTFAVVIQEGAGGSQQIKAFYSNKSNTNWIESTGLDIAPGDNSFCHAIAVGNIPPVQKSQD